MIIPVRCFTCNNIIGSKYKMYLELTKQVDTSTVPVLESNSKDNKDNINTRAFKELGITRYCCKRHLLSHIDLVDKI